MKPEDVPQEWVDAVALELSDVGSLVAAKEREACAEVAEAFPARTHGALATAPYAAAEQAADEIAAAIRARTSPADKPEAQSPQMEDAMTRHDQTELDALIQAGKLADDAMSAEMRAAMEAHEREIADVPAFVRQEWLDG